ncbi:MAG: pentapeptide repeat-containing protein, partial [Bryobacteraceae bacterium]|nr:pentapeptide repeat-containing protein [Bryobacteraceae bacterium]
MRSIPLLVPFLAAVAHVGLSVAAGLAGSDTAKFKDRNISPQEILDAIRRGASIEAESVRVTGDVDLRRLKLPIEFIDGRPYQCVRSRIDLKRSTIQGNFLANTSPPIVFLSRVSMEGVNLERSGSWPGALFRNGLVLDYSQFSGHIDLNHAQVDGDLRLTLVEAAEVFLNRLVLRGSLSADNLVVGRTDPSGRREAGRRSGTVSAEGVDIAGESSFRRLRTRQVSLEKAGLQPARFRGPVNFANAAIGELNMSEARLDEGVSFAGATIGADDHVVGLAGVDSKKDLTFDDATIIGLEDAKVGGVLSFQRSHLQGLCFIRVSGQWAPGLRQSVKTR